MAAELKDSLWVKMMLKTSAEQVPYANHVEVTGPVVIFLLPILMGIFGISTLLLLPSTLVDRIATRGGSRRAGDVAMAIFASYGIGQFMPFFY